MKKPYEKPEMEITKFETEDIAYSAPDPSEMDGIDLN